MSKISKLFPKGIEVVVSALIEDSAGRILLVKQPKWQNKWTLPGGHIEPGETIKKAVLREAFEETGLSLKFVKILVSGELISTKDFHRPAHFIYIDTFCTTKNSDVKLNREANEYIWIRPQEALNMDLAESFGGSIKIYLDLKSNQKFS